MLYINEEQVRQTLPVSECIAVLRDAFATDYVNIPRYRLRSPGSLLHVMSASIPSQQVMGAKVYSTSRQGTNQFVVLLFDEQNGALLAVIEADALGQIRTGASSGLATDYLAQKNARTGAIVGTGLQASTQLLAIDAVRQFAEIRIYSRNAENRKSFIESMQPHCRAALREAETPETCVSDAHVICTITSAKDPVIRDEWISAGAHINAAGSNWANKSELDPATVLRCNLICVDHKEQARIESGELIRAAENPAFSWDSVYELKDIVAGKALRKSDSDLTLFKSNGIALEDVASAAHIYRKVKRNSSGRASTFSNISTH